MNSLKYIVHPYVRLLFLLTIIFGTIFNDRLSQILILYLFVIVPLFFMGSNFKSHLRLILFGILPIFLTFILLYIFIYKNPEYGWDFIVLKTVKLLIYTSVFQLTLMIPAKHLFNTLVKWNLKGEALLTSLSAFTVPNDIVTKSEKILDARFARGFIKKRTIWEKSKQLPFVLVPLIIGIIRTSHERADSWEQKRIISLLSNFRQNNQSLQYDFLLNSSIVFTSITWVVISLILKP